jgi:hypothetical protein
LRKLKGLVVWGKAEVSGLEDAGRKGNGSAKGTLVM